MSEYILKIEQTGIGDDGAILLSPKLGEPIVHCRDCKFFTAKIKPACCTLFECARFDFGAPDDPDGFCAWGERAEEGR